MVDFIVGNGDDVQIPSRTHRFDKFIIEEQGLLTVTPNSRTWLIISANEIRIAGELIARDFLAVKYPLQAVTPEGQQVEHEFEMWNIGGDGGDGTTRPPARFGRGARGTRDYGGGGGGAGGFNPQQNWVFHGEDAEGYRGGRRQNAGANGGRRGRYSNGGLVCLEAKQRLSITGTIDLRGRDGESGHNGRPQTRGGNASGNGGGAPGGEGGRLIVFGATDKTAANVRVDGGMGGAPGKHGKGGSEGEAGTYGWVDWF